MQSGSALLFLGSTHHGGGTNRTPTPETHMGWVEIDGEMADPIRLLG